MGLPRAPAEDAFWRPSNQMGRSCPDLRSAPDPAVVEQALQSTTELPQLRVGQRHTSTLTGRRRTGVEQPRRAGRVDRPRTVGERVPDYGHLDGTGQAALDVAPVPPARLQQAAAPVLDALER